MTGVTSRVIVCEARSWRAAEHEYIDACTAREDPDILSLWEAAGSEYPSDLSAHKAPAHPECRLPDGVIVDREIAQIIAALRASAVRTVECCADGWNSGLAYVIVETMEDLVCAAALLGHVIAPAIRAEIAAVERTPVAQRLGPWWPSLDGWAVGCVAEPGGPCPALAWPRSATPALTQQILTTTGVAPARLRRVPLRTWLARKA